jgi:hypothetical protein
MTQEKIIEFWNRVKIGKPDECWPYLGYKDTKMGYGYFIVIRTKRTEGMKWRRLAHRVAFFLYYKRDSKLCICHKCDNPPCCNPHHFFEGTYEDNNHDRANKGRAVLMPAQVREIRQKYSSGHYSLSKLGIEFKVSKKTILNIVHRRQWNHI